MTNEVGLVGSPSTTNKVTVDIRDDATDAPLRGQVVSLGHPLSDGFLIAIGTVTDIETSNRWHEDANMRGVLKTHGTLPNLSGVGDVRTADVAIQAVYKASSDDVSQGNPPEESAAFLGMSPTTGVKVERVTDAYLKQLLRKHAGKTISLGTIYGMDDVRLPMFMRHFGPPDEGGAGESYHTGVFGMTGSGKTGFATYLLAAYALRKSMSIFVIDPQGQFATERKLPFGLQEWMREQGRPVHVLSLTENLRLPKNAPLLMDLLKQTRFFAAELSMGAKENIDLAGEEFQRLLRGDWQDEDPGTLLRRVLQELVDNEQAMRSIYRSDASRARFETQIRTILTDENEFAELLSIFRPLHSLFAAENTNGGRRRSLWNVLNLVLNPDESIRPYVVLDVSGNTDSSDPDENTAGELLDNAGIKARIIHQICSILENEAKRLFSEDKSLNTMVVFDEAQRYAPHSSDEREVDNLAGRLVDYVRETRKYGLGWTFITQEINSLKREIYSQLSVRAFGFGLTSGTERIRLNETIGEREAIDLYRSFVHPQSIQPSKYPFMITGPVSPLSFTGSPLFLSVYTDFDAFKKDNGFE